MGAGQREAGICGPGEWLAEKHGSRRRRAWRKLHPYRGINVLLLWAAADAKAYAAPIWMTYRQASEPGGQVRKGEKSSPVTYADQIRRTEENDAGEEERRRFFLKQYNVFNVEQIDGLPERFHALAAAPVLDPVERIDAA